MLGTMTIAGKTFPIVEAELHVPPMDETRLLYLIVYSDVDAGFAVWQVDIPLLGSLDDLDGKRLHVRWDQETFEDDTLGTDMIGVSDTTDLNYLKTPDDAYGYGEIQIDFARVKDREYRCRVRCTLTDQAGDPSELPPEAFAFVGLADFTVTADENDPHA